MGVTWAPKNPQTQAWPQVTLGVGGDTVRHRQRHSGLDRLVSMSIASLWVVSLRTPQGHANFQNPILWGNPKLA